MVKKDELESAKQQCFCIKKPSTKGWLIIIASVIVALLLLRAGLSIMQSQLSKIMMAKAAVAKVAVSDVVTREIRPTLDAPGRVVSKEVIKVVPKVSGTLIKRHFKDGDFVKKGQLLLTIDPNKFVIDVNKCKANLQSSIAQAKKADLDYERAKELLARDYISRATYDDTVAKRDMAHAQVAANKALLDDSLRLYGYSKIKANTTGKTGILRLVPGNHVTTEGGSLVEIMSTDPIYVLYSLDSKQFTDLRDLSIMPSANGENPIEIQVTLPNGKVYEHKGIVDFYDNRISESTGTIEFRATIKNPDNLLVPGDFVKVKVFSNKTKECIVVPQAAVLQDQTGRYLYTIDENNKAKMVRIKTSGQDGNDWIVASGLKAGDKIISLGVVTVRDGSPVQVLTEEDIKVYKEMGVSLDDVNANPEKYKDVKISSEAEKK
ncbi:efflux RND transporter periplasmic adaptor subunit [bacterium]|nr:efflux RND transporter periplasmic adaptor subunit [bacterium]